MGLLSVDTNSFSNLFLFLEIKSFIILELFYSIIRNKTSNKAFYTLCRSLPVVGAVEKPQETLSRFLYIKII